MAISTQAALLAKRRAFNYSSTISGTRYDMMPGLKGLLKWLFQYFAQFTGMPDLQVKEFAALDDTETVIADAACKLFAIFAMKTTAVATYTKLTDSATTSSDASSEIRIKQTNQAALIFPDGLALASGATMQGNTTAGGGTSSAADGAHGFCIIGNP